MGCSSSCNTSACCQPPQLIVDEFCQVFDTNNTAVTLWSETAGKQVTITVSSSPDSSGLTSVTLAPVTGAAINYTLTAGDSRTDVLNGINALAVASTTTAYVSGKACITVYRRFY